MRAADRCETRDRAPEGPSGARCLVWAEVGSGPAPCVPQGSDHELALIERVVEMRGQPLQVQAANPRESGGGIRSADPRQESEHLDRLFEIFVKDLRVG